MHHNAPKPRNQRARTRPAATLDRDDVVTHDPWGHPYPAVTSTDMPADIVLARLRRVGGNAPTWCACCPAHGDINPSLSVTETSGGTLLIKCHAGCDTEEVMSAIGLDMSYLFPSAYALEFGGRKGRDRNGLPASHHQTEGSEPEINYDHFEHILRATKDLGHVKELARQLSLPFSSVMALEVGYDNARASWAFPERDSHCRVVGLVYRDADGAKTCEPGSKRGLTIPSNINHLREGPVYLPEGASDTAALHSVGAAAIGRPAAMASRIVQQWLTQLLRGYADRPVVVIGDRDPSKNGRCPGRDGARNLAAYLQVTLGRPVSWALPAAPYKDIREQINAGEWTKGLVIKELLPAARPMNRFSSRDLLTCYE